ncbi:MAG: tetratricopeptide repeat protein [Parachlamydiaceae bacterium]|nr:tetratricopeptide repeat protein [Parachlamydiaceae bacterium]
MAFLKSKSFMFFLLCIFNVVCIGNESPCLHFPKVSFPKNDARLLTADDFFSADLFEHAIDLYQQILADVTRVQSLSEGQTEATLQTAMQSRFHLAQVYFHTGNYQDAISLLHYNINQPKQLSPQLETLRQNSIYLLAISFKQTGKLDEALAMMERYAFGEHAAVQPLQKEAQFEMALLHLLKGDNEKATSQFRALELDPSTRTACLRQLYLARLEITQSDFSTAICLLKAASQKINPDDDLHYELSYLMGESFFCMHSFDKAAEYFDRALPKNFPETCNWYGETLYFHGWCNLNLAETHENREVQLLYFKNAEDSFLKLLAHQPEEKVYLALGQYYLARAKLLQDLPAYIKAEDVLSLKEHFISIEGQTQALLLRAEAAPTYALRNSLYHQIIDANNENSSFYAKGWFLHALNDFEQGQTLIKSQNPHEGKQILANSAQSFRRAFNLLKDGDHACAAAALKYQALALSQAEHAEADILAFQVMDELIQSYPDQLAALESPDEIYYLRGFFGLRIAESQDKHKYALLAQQSLKEAASLKSNKFGDAALNQLAAWHYRKSDFTEAEKIYLQLIDEFPASQYLQEAWLWTAYCADKLQKDPQVARVRRRNLLEQYPQSCLAPEAYFSLYTYRDYLEGDREAIKHLQHFAKQYPETPFLMQAFYLIGLDSKRNRKTPEGKWIRKKSLTDAIDAFQNAETLFDILTGKGLIPSDKLNFYTNVYYRLILERAMANLAIADESQGAKQLIYLEYAEEVFKNLLADFDLPDNAHVNRLLQSEAYPALYEESAFWLAQTYVKRQKDSEAESLLSQMLARYQHAKITRGYYLSRIKYELGKIASRQDKHLKALQLFKESEDAGNTLSTSEKLDLWIQQSHSYRDLQKFDDAILILSKVANDAAISPLRLKAMFLRADIYELQKRPELARKQLESLAKKGGDWALKAKEKLEKNYGY